MSFGIINAQNITHSPWLFVMQITLAHQNFESVIESEKCLAKCSLVPQHRKRKHWMFGLTGQEWKTNVVDMDNHPGFQPRQNLQVNEIHVRIDLSRVCRINE